MHHEAQPAADNTVNDFLQELSAQFEGGVPDARIKCTRELLRGADDLLKSNTTLMGRIADKTLPKYISGTTFREEIVDGHSYDRPVVDLVQQGGTMLGIGLVGYTYIMERVGVRFRSMAGTSAGAINTLLLAAMPEHIYTETSPFDKDRKAVKSEMLAYLVANTDFSKFLDREGFLRKIQDRAVKYINFVGRHLGTIMVVLGLVMIATSYWFYWLLNEHIFKRENHLTEMQLSIYHFISATLGLLVVVAMVAMMLLAIFRKNMGVNPGRVPYDWLKRILSTRYVNIRTTQDLMDKKKNEQPLNYQAGPRIQPPKDPRLVFISANLTHNRIVKFPEHNRDYWHKDYAALVSPAAYVRASMSLPFIFYPFIPHDNHLVGGPYQQKVEVFARFVDGGMLSNFPIREFHVPPTQDPLYPTFGVLLGTPKPESKSDTESIRKKFHSLSVFSYILSFISTFRNFYDADFLRSNKEFNMLVKSVNTDGFNSLDFGMGFEKKQEIFMAGAKTAIDHLEKFNWEEYLKVRKESDSPKNVQP